MRSTGSDSEDASFVIARALAGAGAKIALADIDQASLASEKSALSDLTSVETFMLDVRYRRAPSSATDSGLGFAITLSPTHTESNAPERSASCASFNI